MAGSTFRYRWAAAEVRWGYRVAATLTDCELVVNGSGATLTARLAQGDTFRLSQQPLVLFVTRATPWRFPIDSLQIAGSTCHARLGPQLED